jgi:predicted Kef-type K+ transport protein
MEHEASLLVTIVLGLVLAFATGFIASKLGLPPLVGYLVAGPTRPVHRSMQRSRPNFRKSASFF